MLPTNQQQQANVVWQPIPGTSQEIALDSRADHTLYTGSRGPGKTDVQLMRFRRRVGLGYGAFWRGVIFDRRYKNLDDLVSKSKRWFNRFGDGAQFLESTHHYKWVWPTGEELLFRSIEKKDDYNNFHGQEFPFIGWNELTKYPNPDLYEMMMSCNRSSFTPEKDAPIDPKTGERMKMDPIPLEVFSTTNSYGPGHAWVKKRFIDPAPYGKIVKTKFTVFDPAVKRDVEIERTQVAIFGSYKENPYLSPLYIAGLQQMKDVNRRKSWLEGDWNVVAGGAFDDVWNEKIHVIPVCPIPASWHLDRAFDWGSSKPFSVGWFAESNGEELELPYCAICGLLQRNIIHAIKNTPQSHDFEAKKFAPPAGSLIQIHEWYGARQDGYNEGLKLSARNIALGIKERENFLISRGLIQKKPYAGPADNQIRDVREDDVDTIERKMAKEGVRWTRSDKSPGSRKIGLQLTRDLLENAIGNETGDCNEPGLYFMDCCSASIATIPVLPRDEDFEDDVDTDAEDHCYDMLRYRILKGKNRYAKKVKVSFVN
jgi:hypothetical protein